MSNQESINYETRVRAAVRPLLAFNAQLLEELDDEDGAFGFWRGGCDWKTYALLADYLIQSVLGTTTALEAAGLTAIEHRQVTYSANAKARVAYKDLHAGSLTPTQYLNAVIGSSDARKRSLRAESAAEHTFFHMGQALDRFSAALVIVGGFGVKDVVTSDWKTVQDLWAALDEDREKGTVAPRGTAGRDIQRRLLAPAGLLQNYGSEILAGLASGHPKRVDPQVAGKAHESPTEGWQHHPAVLPPAEVERAANDGLRADARGTCEGRA
ncbi:hypothetical protein BH683_025795 [Williamsia sp. 1138]|uniref:hypothetical protein n=1 Tax=Williamsia sp. 1138 TaxID=1903117 RepID=UPI000A114772|nr:hypothetical protein [Williamsia sp. 1138]OZG26218.1 hypothetical protein BH683_025795 [Williamsia sp. 1138]